MVRDEDDHRLQTEGGSDAVASAILCAVICWAGSVLRTVLEPLELILLRGMLHKMKNIMDQPEHPQHNDSGIERLQSEASSFPLQHRLLKEILPAHSFNHCSDISTH